MNVIHIRDERKSWWVTGTPRREFFHVDDGADACVHLVKFYSGDTYVNVGSGEDITILELARLRRDRRPSRGQNFHPVSLYS